VVAASVGGLRTAVKDGESGVLVPGHDPADYAVVLEPQAHPIGTVNEDFAVESLPGDVFQLGNTSYRILRVERGTVRVEDARGAPPGIPFWLGEAPGRSMELSQSLSRLYAAVTVRLEEGGLASAMGLLREEIGLSEPAAEQVADYLASARAALGALPPTVEPRAVQESGNASPRCRATMLSACFLKATTCAPRAWRAAILAACPEGIATRSTTTSC